MIDFIIMKEDILNNVKFFFINFRWYEIFFDIDVDKSILRFYILDIIDY